MMVWKLIFLFQGCILRFHVNLPGCNPYKSRVIAPPPKFYEQKPPGRVFDIPPLVHNPPAHHHAMFEKPALPNPKNWLDLFPQITTVDNPLQVTLRIHAWYIYLHLVDFYGKCRQIYYTWILREVTLRVRFYVLRIRDFAGSNPMTWLHIRRYQSYEYSGFCLGRGLDS